MRKNVIILIILAALSAGYAMAQGNNKAEREAWMKEMTQYKHEFFVKELKLTTEQQKAFFPLYDAMEADTRRLVDEVRRMEKSVRDKGNNASDTELEKVAEALFELKGRENVLEMRYFEKFKAVLSPKQLFYIKQAERKFNRLILKEHRKRINTKKK